MTHAAPTTERLDFIDLLLVLLFLFGIYTGIALPIAKGVPFPSAPSGIAGVLLLLRHAGRVREIHVMALLGVLVLYLANVLAAPNDTYLMERIKGFIQITYSLVIGYGFFLTLVHADRRQLGRLFFVLCVALVVGCLLERTVEPFRNLSDAVRGKLYDALMVYQSDQRDQELYGGIRPKLFTSEPSAVSFGFTFFSFGWLMIAPWRDWRLKLGLYVGLLAAAYVAMRGPTLMLGIVLIVPYLMMIEPWRARTPKREILAGRVVGIALLGVALAVVTVVAMSYLFAARVEEVSSASDPSFFYRIIGPPMIALDVALRHPFTGAGLTGEEFIEDRVLQVYYASPLFSPDWKYGRAAEVITNYFWLHWIYLGPLGGLAVIAALTIWLRTLGVANLLACWAAWVMLGQASGAYVSPKTWTVLLLAAAASVLHRRQPESAVGPRARRRAARPLRMAMERT
jgi:hypothetical protein